MVGGRMNYTKGEWIAKAQKANRYWKAEVRTPGITDDDGNAVEFGQLIAVCYGQNTVANANLIASAPDLYEALKAIVEYHQKYSEAIPCLVDAIKALAKAEGKE